MKRTVTVRYSVDYDVEVEFDDQETCLADEVCNIDVPENDSKYVEQSFQPFTAWEDGVDITEQLEPDDLNDEE